MTDLPRPRRWWPKVAAEERLAIEETVGRNWGAGEMANRWSEGYADITARTFIALKELYLADAAVLGL